MVIAKQPFRRYYCLANGNKTGDPNTEISVKVLALACVLVV